MRAKTTFLVAFILVSLRVLSFPIPVFDGAVLGQPAIRASETRRETRVEGSFRTDALPLLTKYCVGCHGQSKPKAGLNLAAFQDESSARSKRKTWERVREYVEGSGHAAGGPPQPTRDEVGGLTRWIKSALKPDDCGRTFDPGRVTIRRLEPRRVQQHDPRPDRHRLSPGRRLPVG